MLPQNRFIMNCYNDGISLPIVFHNPRQCVCHTMDTIVDRGPPHSRDIRYVAGAPNATALIQK